MYNCAYLICIESSHQPPVRSKQYNPFVHTKQREKKKNQSETQPTAKFFLIGQIARVNAHYKSARMTMHLITLRYSHRCRTRLAVRNSEATTHCGRYNNTHIHTIYTLQFIGYLMVRWSLRSFYIADVFLKYRVLYVSFVEKFFRAYV